MLIKLTDLDISTRERFHTGITTAPNPPQSKGFVRIEIGFDFELGPSLIREGKEYVSIFWNALLGRRTDEPAHVSRAKAALYEVDAR